MFVEIPILSDWIEYPRNKVLSGGSSSWRIKFFMISKDLYVLQHKEVTSISLRDHTYFSKRTFSNSENLRKQESKSGQKQAALYNNQEP